VANHQVDHLVSTGNLAEAATSGTAALRRVEELGYGLAFDAMVLAFNVCEALVGLGFTAKQADEATSAVAADTDDPAVVNGDVGLLLRRALALLGRNR
jgi:Holliday junction resolvasome RuvABC DNA-binding subunit